MPLRTSKRLKQKKESKACGLPAVKGALRAAASLGRPTAALDCLQLPLAVEAALSGRFLTKEGTMVRTSLLKSDLAAARRQGWAIEVIDLHTVRLSHPEAGIHVVDDTKGGEHARRALRLAMQAIREGAIQ